IDEALSVLREHGGDARVLAGGQSLIPAMRYRLARPAVLVDINRLDELDYVREYNRMLSIGARTRDATLERIPSFAESYPLLADTAAVVADPVVRQMGTVVGSLCHNDPAGDWCVTALAAGAEVVVRGAGAARVVPIDEFLIDSFTTAVADGELALEVRFPAAAPHTSGSYQKIERKVGDFATVSAAVQITLREHGAIARAGIALGAVGPKAIRVAAAEQLLRGTMPSAEAIAAAADAAREAADPSADTRGSVEYKKEMAAVLVRRALLATFARLGVEGLR
ncbi:MAG TPA: xanthine dehydrogenase family protein subunit M, partial [Candidatus Acidoferrum sp.]|nr:xanthine dehydrogenase family protein subunit M [Candidatus Acidoferrum sp.]